MKQSRDAIKNPQKSEEQREETEEKRKRHQLLGASGFENI